MKKGAANSLRRSRRWLCGDGAIAELFDLVRSVFASIPTSSQRATLVLIHSRDRILPELSAELGDYALSKLKARGIEFLLNSRVTGATAQGVLLEEGGPVATRTLVWTAGNQPNPLLRGLQCERNRAGASLSIVCLQVKDLTNVWAVGDCAEIPDIDNEGRSYPPTAQHAMREGKLLLKTFRRPSATNP